MRTVLKSILLKIGIGIAAGCLLVGHGSPADASVISVPTGYEVGYDITLRYLPTNGGDILDAFVFEWNEGGDFNVDYPSLIAGRSTTNISHVISFAPTSALIIGYALGIPGVGDEKDHLFTFVNSTFGNSVIGLKWSEAFPGVPPVPRTGHNAMVNLLRDAAAGNAIAFDQLTTFVTNEAGGAAFDPAGDFMAIEWTVGGPDIPEPGSLTLTCLALACLGWSRRKKG